MMGFGPDSSVDYFELIIDISMLATVMWYNNKPSPIGVEKKLATRHPNGMMFHG